MKECRHGIDADACELCQEHIRAVAARLGARGGTARKLALSPERRAEIARIAAQRRWHDVVWKDIAIKPYRPWSPERRQAARERAKGRWAGVDTKRKAIEAALSDNPEWDRAALAAHVGCTESHVVWVGTQIGIYKPLSKSERIERNRARAVERFKDRSKDTKASRVRALLAANPDMRTSDVSRATGALVPMVSTIRREMGLPRQKKLGSPKMVITQDALADPEKVAIMRRVLALLRRGYVAARISQLLDIPEKHVRSYIAAVKDPNIKLPRVVKSRPMTEEDLQTAYTLWKEGNTYVSIAAKLDRDLNQIKSAMLSLLRSLGEK